MISDTVAADGAWNPGAYCCNSCSTRVMTEPVAPTAVTFAVGASFVTERPTLLC